MKDLISIIIPIYNVERYIKKTVESVINQDYSNIEIILVDDGSTDNSGKIIDEIKNTDSRIICIHKENGGVSSARNTGLDVAKGTYVTFIDGDDWVETNYVSYLVYLIQKYKCKVAMNKNNFSVLSSKSKDEDYTISDLQAIENIYLGNIFVAVWNKMYSLSVIREKNIRFDESIWYGEGMLFNIDYLQEVDLVAIGEKAVYHQISNPNSAMRKFSVESNLCGIRSLEIQKKHLNKQNSKIISAWEYHYRAVYLTMVSGIVRCNLEDEYQNIYKEGLKFLRKDLFVSLKVKIPIRLKLVYIFWALFPNIMIKRCKNKVVKY